MVRRGGALQRMGLLLDCCSIGCGYGSQISKYRQSKCSTRLLEMPFVFQVLCMIFPRCSQSIGGDGPQGQSWCQHIGVLECLDDASLHLDFTSVSLVSGQPRPPVVTAPVHRGCPCQDPLGCLRCPGRMASGAERQPLWFRCVGGGGHVMWTLLIHAFLQAHLLD